MRNPDEESSVRTKQAAGRRVETKPAFRDDHEFEKGQMSSCRV